MAGAASPRFPPQRRPTPKGSPGVSVPAGRVPAPAGGGLIGASPRLRARPAPPPPAGGGRAAEWAAPLRPSAAPEGSGLRGMGGAPGGGRGGPGGEGAAPGPAAGPEGQRGGRPEPLHGAVGHRRPSEPAGSPQPHPGPAWGGLKHLCGAGPAGFILD